MERKLILDLLTGFLGFMVFAFIWVGLFVGRKHVNWDNAYEGVAFIFMSILVFVATVACVVNAWFWFTEHIIYLP
jgi:ABC-type uncharacterized transport system permease subunit